MATINSSHLLSTDLDNPAADITYKVIQSPKHGNLILMPDKVEVNSFTQDDLNRNKLIFQQTIEDDTQATAGTLRNFRLVVSFLVPL